MAEKQCPDNPEGKRHFKYKVSILASCPAERCTASLSSSMVVIVREMRLRAIRQKFKG
jgi:hypothetical protein